DRKVLPAGLFDGAGAEGHRGPPARRERRETMKGTVIRRPESLREVAAESETYGDFGYNLKDFLHEFAMARERGLPLERMLAEEPPRLAAKFSEGKICDAFLAST